MKRIFVILVIVASHLAYSQDFVHKDSMYLRNVVSFDVTRNNVDTLEVYDPADKRSIFMPRMRDEISEINGKIVNSATKVKYKEAELKQLQEYVSSFFAQMMKKYNYVEGEYKLHICGVIVDKSGMVCKYEYHGLDYWNENGSPRPVPLLDANIVSKMMTSLPRVYAHPIEKSKSDYAYIPEVILACRFSVSKGGKTKMKLVSVPGREHPHLTPRI